MGWEQRKGKLYYYRKERGADGRVRSIYCGAGERGELAAREDAERRTAAQPAIILPVYTAEPIRTPEPIPTQQIERRPAPSPPISPPRSVGPHVPIYPPRPSRLPRCALAQWRSLWQKER